MCASLNFASKSPVAKIRSISAPKNDRKKIILEDLRRNILILIYLTRDSKFKICFKIESVFVLMWLIWDLVCLWFKMCLLSQKKKTQDILTYLYILHCAIKKSAISLLF